MTATYGEQRTEAQKLYDEQVMERVKKGMALLEEKYGPTWVDKIDMKTLDLTDSAVCVLGQVYDDQARDWQDGYDFGLVALGLTEDDSDDSEYGFNVPLGNGMEWPMLQAAWEDALTPIVSKGDAS